jgi:orotidine-5'-phosphate decarboxylase
VFRDGKQALKDEETLRLASALATKAREDILTTQQMDALVRESLRAKIDSWNSTRKPQFIIGVSSNMSHRLAEYKEQGWDTDAWETIIETNNPVNGFGLEAAIIRDIGIDSLNYNRQEGGSGQLGQPPLRSRPNKT